MFFKKNYIIHSESENGYWSNNTGWGDIELATKFSAFESIAFELPLSSKNDATWVKHETKRNTKNIKTN